MAEISAAQRQRLLFLHPPPDHAASEWLTPDEFKEYEYLLQLAGLIPDTPLKTWEPQHISGRQAQLATLAARWPRRPLSGRQAVVALWEQRMLWDMTPHQRELWRMKR